MLQLDIKYKECLDILLLNTPSSIDMVHIKSFWQTWLGVHTQLVQKLSKDQDEVFNDENFAQKYIASFLKKRAAILSGYLQNRINKNQQNFAGDNAVLLYLIERHDNMFLNLLVDYHAQMSQTLSQMQKFRKVTQAYIHSELSGR